MVIGDFFKDILCESFIDSATNRIRVRPLSNQTVPSYLVIECLKSIREQHPVGTKFLAQEVKVCKKSTGRIYLRAKDQKIKKV